MCLPQAMPVKSAAESLQNAATSGMSTIPAPCGSMRSCSMQENAHGITSPATAITHTSCSTSAPGLP